jgi:NAD(P)-dependent dehydrogenase (short-subunit alcohol dehydrogenase family)
MNTLSSILDGQKVIVLGGSSGIGLATARAAATEGARVLIVSRNPSHIDQALATLPGDCQGNTADLGDEQAVQRIFQQAGPFDHLAYTAGGSMAVQHVIDLTTQTIRDYFELRFWGAFAAVKYSVPFLNPVGSISLTSGIANRRPGKGWALGASSSGALEGFTTAMAVELAPIRVNIVSPGMTRTNLWSGFPVVERQQMYAQAGNRLLTGHVADPADIAQAYLFLMKNPFVTGQVVVADGGALLV